MHFHMEIEKLYFIDKVKIASTPLKNSTQKPVTFLPILGNIVYMYLKGTRDNFKIHVNFMKPTFLCRLRQDEAYDKK